MISGGRDEGNGREEGGKKRWQGSWNIWVLVMEVWWGRIRDDGKAVVKEMVG